MLIRNHDSWRNMEGNIPNIIVSIVPADEKP